MSRRTFTPCCFSGLSPRILVAGAVLALAAHSVAQAQLPTTRLNSIFPPGAKQGQTVEVTLGGEEIDQVQSLRFSHPGITTKPVTREPNMFEKGPQPVPGKFQVQVAANVPVGVYKARAIGRYGISNSRFFMVSDLNEINEKEGNNTLKDANEVPLETVVNGAANGGADIDYFKIAAKKGQRIIIDCWGERIDSRMDPTLALYNARGRQVDSNRDTNHTDPLIDFTAPEDGDYTLKIHDFVYGGGGEYFYRLYVSTGPYVDYILPPAITPGAKGKFVLYGRNLPGGADAGVSVDGKPLQKLSVDIQAPGGAAATQLDVGDLVEPEGVALDGFEYRLTTKQGASNPVLIGFSSAPLVAEQEPNNSPDKPQKISVPCEFAGQFQQPRNVDWLSFDATKGEVYWIEIFSQRRGLPTDPYVLIERSRDRQGRQGKGDVGQGPRRRHGQHRWPDVQHRQR